MKVKEIDESKDLKKTENDMEDLELPFFVSFGDDVTPESRKQYWDMYYRQQEEKQKNENIDLGTKKSTKHRNT